MRAGEAASSLQPLHRHADARIILFVAGRYRERGFGECTEFSPGDVIIRPAYYAHDGFGLTQDAKYIYFRTRPGALGAFFSKCGWRARRVRCRDWRDLARALHDPDAADDVLARRTEALARSANNSTPAAVASTLCTPETPRLKALADQHNLSPWDLTRQFARVFGMSPSRYRQQARVQNALYLLADTMLPLSAIAVQAGFADQSHLGRALRGATGLRPDQLRRKLTS